MAAPLEVLITLSHIKTVFDASIVHDDVNATIFKGEIFGLVGGSGAGKTVLMRHLMGLSLPQRGSVVYHIEGRLVPAAQLAPGRLGVMFQYGALLSSLTVLENLLFPVMELNLSPFPEAKKKAIHLLEEVGLSEAVLDKFPKELSGGMTKRIAIARALMTNPDILFLDEPTAGLDPLAADQFDDLLLRIHKASGLSVVMITHDLDSLKKLCHRVGILVDKHMITTSISDVHNIQHPWIQAYFSCPRAKNLFG